MYRGAVDRPQIEKTHSLSKVPAEMLAATVEKAAIKLVNLIPLFAVPGTWAPDPEMSKSAMWEFVATLRMTPVAGKNGEILRIAIASFYWISGSISTRSSTLLASVLNRSMVFTTSSLFLDKSLSMCTIG